MKKACFVDNLVCIIGYLLMVIVISLTPIVFGKWPVKMPPGKLTANKCLLSLKNYSIIKKRVRIKQQSYEPKKNTLTAYRR